MRRVGSKLGRSASNKLMLVRVLGHRARRDAPTPELTRTDVNAIA